MPGVAGGPPPACAFYLAAASLCMLPRAWPLRDLVSLGPSWTVTGSSRSGSPTATSAAQSSVAGPQRPYSSAMDAAEYQNQRTSEEASK
jgi:hypothetical protein